MTSIAPGTRLGHYQVLDPIGAGGMGEVYRARDTRLGRDVALKVLPPIVASDPDRLSRFEREAHLLASLNHPHIAAIYGVEETGGHPALVLELVEGATLSDRIESGPLPVEDAVRIARQIAEALEYAHERGVIHRDLKPANIKLDAEGRVKILDFGLAKAISGDPGGTASDPSMSPTLTSLGSAVGMILGTAAYMSPEQARGSTVDRRADIWAFGAVLWEMLTGRRAFEGDTVSDTLASVLRAPVEWETLPASTPPPVVRLLRRCLERDPKKRLRDIGEARILLETLGSEPEPAPVAATAAVPAARSRLRSAVPWVLFVGAAVVSAFALRPRAEIPPAVLKFEMSPPAQLSRITWPRISPDGRMIVFIGIASTGKSSLWIRPLDSLESYVLSGTENALRPFWSPDSRFVAYFLGRKLMKSPVSGGPAQLVCEAEAGADGSWGTAGVILFDGGTADPIRRCDASGGVPSVQIRAEPKKKQRLVGWPFFLPDGRHFLLKGEPSPEAGSQSSILLGSLDQPDAVELVPSDSRAEYANGFLIYVMQNTLVARRFDLGKLEPSGDPIPLAAGVTQADPGHFSVSSNGSLAYMGSSAGGSSQLVWVDRGGRELGTEGPAADYGDLALSPDGTRLAYDMSDGSQKDIWIRDLRRGVAMRLTSDPKDDVWPVWSPDGTRIAFATGRGGLYALMQKSSSGTGADEPLIANDVANLGPDSWTPDGRSLLYSSFPASASSDVMTLPMTGTHQPAAYLAEKANERGGSISPDGRFVAYRSDETGQAEIYVQPYPATGAKWTISTQGGRSPQWRRDGRELFYFGPDDMIYAVPITMTPSFDAGPPKALFKKALSSAGVVRNRWAVSADGQRFLLNSAPTEKSTTPFSVVVNWPQTIAHP